MRFSLGFLRIPKIGQNFLSKSLVIKSNQHRSDLKVWNYPKSIPRLVSWILKDSRSYNRIQNYIKITLDFSLQKLMSCIKHEKIPYVKYLLCISERQIFVNLLCWIIRLGQGTGDHRRAFEVSSGLVAWGVNQIYRLICAQVAVLLDFQGSFL